jgi:hypothetical protein
MFLMQTYSKLVPIFKNHGQWPVTRTEREIDGTAASMYNSVGKFVIIHLSQAGWLSSFTLKG